MHLLRWMWFAVWFLNLVFGGLKKCHFFKSTNLVFMTLVLGYMATLYSYTSLTKNHSRCAYLNASSSMDVIWFFISLMDSTVTGPITSFSRTCKPASMISKCVTPGIGKSANKINEKQINKYFLDINVLERRTFLIPKIFTLICIWKNNQLK